MGKFESRVPFLQFASAGIVVISLLPRSEGARVAALLFGVVFEFGYLW